MLPVLVDAFFLNYLSRDQRFIKKRYFTNIPTIALNDSFLSGCCSLQTVTFTNIIWLELDPRGQAFGQIFPGPISIITHLVNHLEVPWAVWQTPPGPLNTL